MATPSYSKALYGGQKGYLQGTADQSYLGTQNTGTQQTNKQVNNTQQPQQPQTFAALQQQGIARPAPQQVQAPPAMPQYGGSQQAQAARGQLQQQVAQAVAAPTRYDSGTYQTIEKAARDNLTADFDRQRDQLDTNMARRGLYDSTIAAQGWQDLGGQQARAMADLNASLLKDAAATQMQDRLGAAGMTGTLAELAGSQDLAEYEANRVGAAADFDAQLRAQLANNDMYNAGADRALEAAKAGGDLGLRERELSQSGEQFGQQLQLSRDELALRGDLGQQEQELARARLQQEGRLTEAEQNISRQRLMQEQSQFERSASQTDLERQLRERLGLSELTGYVGNQSTVERDRVQSDADLARQNMLGTLLGMLGITNFNNLSRQWTPPSGSPSGTGGGGSVPPTTSPGTGSNGGNTGGGDGSTGGGSGTDPVMLKKLVEQILIQGD